MKKEGGIVFRIAAILLAVLVLCSTWGAAETLLVASDLHLTEDDAREAALEALRAADADAVILLGDSTNNAHAGEHARVLAFLASLDAPAYVVPGNHDVTLDISDFIGMYRDYGWNQAFSRDTDSASCAVMTPGGTCLLLLDTNDMPGHVAPLGGISDETCAWVADTLARLPEGTPVVACGHHPILPAERWTRTPGAEALAKALRGVKLYLCGHDHSFAAHEAGGLQQITVGQPQAYPGWAGLLEVTEAAIRWRVLPLYDDATRQDMREGALALSDNMARGTLAGTVHEDDPAAVAWFSEVFELWLTSQLDGAACERLLAAPGAQLWREIETKTVVKRWIFSLLENPPADVRAIDMPF